MLNQNVKMNIRNKVDKSFSLKCLYSKDVWLKSLWFDIPIINRIVALIIFCEDTSKGWGFKWFKIVTGIFLCFYCSYRLFIH